MRCFPVGDRAVCGEVIELTLRGDRAHAPASIVCRCSISDLPVFLRWRGEPPFGADPVGAARRRRRPGDRRLVASGTSCATRELAELFERTAVSDIAWARTDDWRVELAGRWPAIREQEIRVRGPRAEAALLRGWLGARLDRAVRRGRAGRGARRAARRRGAPAAEGGATDAERPAERRARPLRPRPDLRGGGTGGGWRRLTAVRPRSDERLTHESVSTVRRIRHDSGDADGLVGTLRGMAPPRIEIVGSIYHVNGKAVRRYGSLFRDEIDRLTFLELLREAGWLEQLDASGVLADDDALPRPH